MTRTIANTADDRCVNLLVFLNLTNKFQLTNVIVGRHQNYIIWKVRELDNARSIFMKILEDGCKGIESMIGQREENLFLDFKEKSTRDKAGIEKSDKGTYAKALSGFSNSSGGVIIWGIKSRKQGEGTPDMAIELMPIKFLKTFLTDLNGLINEAVVPINTGIRNQTIYLNDDEGTNEGFIITYIPESELIPHRAMLGDNHYYTRAGDSFVRMEHHLLEDSFGKRQKPNLDIYCQLMRFGSANSIRFGLNLGIKNKGKYLATYPALRIKVLNDLDYATTSDSLDFLSYNLNVLLSTKYKVDREGLFFLGGINDAIHPGTYIEVTRLHPKESWFDKSNLISFAAQNRSLRFEYEIFAEGCRSIVGEISFSAEEIMDFLHL
ncbi:helix-turn-helix domain-containing protein [Paenibacillus sp. Y412MC10]|uniref:AlbA family DNA-binding domain-containing protein n=1 Tax=Geobacillus sp. (strain Y412MC10) TaxID=481743 RepID=UPI0011AB4CFD|nr:ATP-binding protein [Paenibacillus sp. Y412MC10]